MATTTSKNRVRELQRTLYRAAKADPQRRFHALYDKVHRRDVLERAWGQVRRNRGAAGIDRQTIDDVSSTGLTGCSASWPQTSATATTVRFCPSGVHPQARQPRAAAVVDPGGP